MPGIIVCCLLTFFAIFGLIEMVRFICAQWCGDSIPYHVIIPVKNDQEGIECTVRGVCQSSSVIFVDMGSEDDTVKILNKMKSRRNNMSVMTYDEYLNFLDKKKADLHGYS